jgi:hypothetical protein
MATLGVGEQPETDSPAKLKTAMQIAGRRFDGNDIFSTPPRQSPREITAAFAPQQLLSSGVAGR